MRLSGPKRVVAILLIIGSMISCRPVRDSTSVPPSLHGNQGLIQELRNLHFDRYLVKPQFEPDHAQDQGWEVYDYPSEELKCVEGGEYFIMARRGVDADKVVLWLEGGGACYPGRDDCTTEAQFHPWIEEYGLASLQEENPVITWNFIYVPYCDGSLHMGDSDADYDGDGVIDHWHWGLKTTSAAVRLMRELYPDSQEILIAGCSAGGAGTIGAVPVVRLQFPKARLYILNVSGLGLVNPAMIEVREVVKETWNIGQFIPENCTRCNQQITYMYSWLLDRDPNLRVGLFSSYRDAVPSSGWGMAPEAFESLILRTTESIREDHPNSFKRYFIDSDVHCLDDYSYEVNGVSFWDWIGYLVNDDPRWVDNLE
jgi:hypothetical protein